MREVIDQHQAGENQAGLGRQQMECPSLGLQTHHWPAHAAACFFLRVLNLTSQRSPSACHYPLQGELGLKWLSRDESSRLIRETKQMPRGRMKGVCVYLGGGETGEGRVLMALLRRKVKSTHSETCKTPKTKLPWFPDLAQGWAPGTFFFSFIIKYSGRNLRRVFKSQWPVLVRSFRLYLFSQIRSFPFQNGMWPPG